jgi:hypothetical protein
MSGSNVNANLTANIAQFQAAMQQAAATMQAFATTTTQAQAQAQAALNATGQAARNAGQAVQQGAGTAGAAANALGGTLNNLGITAALAGRKISAMIDETLAGRWRQFDGTLASVVTRLIAANAALGGMVVAAGAAAAAVAYLAYQWVATANAIRAAEGAQVLYSQHTVDSNNQITSSIKRMRDEQDLWQGQARDVVGAFSRMGGAAADYKPQLQDLATQQAKLTHTDPIKIAEQMAKLFDKGSHGALQWAEALHLLDGKIGENGQSLLSQIETLHKSGQESAAIDLILKEAKKTYGDAGQAAIQYGKDVRKANTEAILGAMGSETGAPVTPPTLPPEPTLPDNKVDEVLVERLRNLDKLNAATDKRAEAESRLARAKQSETDAKAAGDAGALARAQEAVATAEKERFQIHTTLEEDSHRTRMGQLSEQLGVVRDNAKQRLEITRQMLEEEKRYYGEHSTEFVAAQRAIGNAERGVVDQDFRIRSLKYQQDIVLAKGHKDRQVQIYNEWLRDAEAIYGKDSTQYQSILLKEDRAQMAHAKAGVDMTKEKFRQELAEADGNYLKQLEIEDRFLAYLRGKYGERSKEYQHEALHRIEIANHEAKQEAAVAADAARTQEAVSRSQQRMAQRVRDFQTGGPKKFSLLDLLGFRESDAAAFEQQMEQVRQTHEQAMTAIKKQQEAAVNPRELQTALNEEKREMQHFAEETQKIQLQEAEGVRSAWREVSDGIALKTMTSAVEWMVNKITTWSLKMAGRWIVDRLTEEAASAASETAKTAATAAGTTARTGIQTAATAKDSAGFFVRTLRWIAQELGMTAATTTGAATRTGAETAAQASSAATTATSNTGRAESNIGVAATGAAAAVAAVPLAGPALAPAAAASTAATLQPYAAMAALDVGAWDVPRDMVAQIHKNEMVVPSDFASGLRGQLSGTGPSNPVALNFQPNIAMSGSTGMSRNAVQTVMGRAAGEMYKYMHNVYRTGTVALPGSRLA